MLCMNAPQTQANDRQWCVSYTERDFSLGQQNDDATRKTSSMRFHFAACLNHFGKARKMVCTTRQTLVFGGANLYPLGKSTASVRMSLRILREV